MPQDRPIRENNPPMDVSWGQSGFIDGPPPEAFAPVQSKTPSMLHQERIRQMSAARTMGNPAPAAPILGPVTSANPLMNTGQPFTPGVRPHISPANDPDIRNRNQNPNPNMPGIIVPRPDL